MPCCIASSIWATWGVRAMVSVISVCQRVRPVRPSRHCSCGCALGPHMLAHRCKLRLICQRISAQRAFRGVPSSSDLSGRQIYPRYCYRFVDSRRCASAPCLLPCHPSVCGSAPPLNSSAPEAARYFLGLRLRSRPLETDWISTSSRKALLFPRVADDESPSSSIDSKGRFNVHEPNLGHHGGVTRGECRCALAVHVLQARVCCLFAHGSFLSGLR